MSDDIFEQMILDSGADPRTVSLAHLLKLARFYANVAMAKVKLGKTDVTSAEICEVAKNPETAGNDELTALTIRAGESRYLWFLAGCGCYDQQFAGWRIDTNNDLDEGEKKTLLSLPWPTPKRQAGRPARSRDFAKMLAVDVEYRRAVGEASSIEKVVEKMIGRGRDGKPIDGVTPILVMPRGKKSRAKLHAMLHSAALEAPSLIEEARQQGEIVGAGGQPDPAFIDRLLQFRDILANPSAVQSMLRARGRKN